jgi:hypothetical protein
MIQANALKFNLHFNRDEPDFYKPLTRGLGILRKI